MEQRTLKGKLLYSPKRGVFYWIKPPGEHSELMGEEAGSPSNSEKPYHVISIDGKKYKRSRLAFLYMTGRWPHPCVDHINGDSLDDRWLNLREATVTQNMQNMTVSPKKKSCLPMGVRQNKSGRFSARITVNKEQIQIGTFDTLEEAERAYMQARGKYFGQFA